MSQKQLHLTGRERTFPVRELIVTKTDAKGLITYVNPTFVNISGYQESESVGKPHSIVRHPDTPRAIFRFLWSEVQAGRDVIAAVNNRAKNGDHYWVLAMVSSDINQRGEVLGYHSTRRNLSAEARTLIVPLYREMVELEKQFSGQEGMDQAMSLLVKTVGSKGYEAWIYQWLEVAV